MCVFFQAEDGIWGRTVTGVETCALPDLWFFWVGFLLLVFFLMGGFVWFFFGYFLVLCVSRTIAV